MMKVRVRQLYADDLNSLSTLFKDFFNFAERSIDRSSPDRLIKSLYFHYIFSVPLGSLGLDTFIGFVAQAEDRNIVGAVIARRFPLVKSWVIGPVVVHGDFRNSGIATQMMNLTIERLKQKNAKMAILSVERKNIQGRIFFQKFGFTHLKPIFSNHDIVRNYVRRIALTYSFIHELPYESASLRKTGTENQQTRRNMWHVMLKQF